MNCERRRKTRAEVADAASAPLSTRSTHLRKLSQQGRWGSKRKGSRGCNPSFCLPRQAPATRSPPPRAASSPLAEVQRKLPSGADPPQRNFDMPRRVSAEKKGTLSRGSLKIQFSLSEIAEFYNRCHMLQAAIIYAAPRRDILLEVAVPARRAHACNMEAASTRAVALNCSHFYDQSSTSSTAQTNQPAG